MTYFLRSGTRFNVSAQAALDLHEALPVGTYTVKFDQMGGFFYLEAIESFVIKGKVYGDTQKHSTRILDTFQDRPGSTGVMLSGEKGSGKTLLAKMVSLDAQLQNIPTIVINQPWCGDEFNGFMQMIEQPVVVIFDEFEKVYDEEDQEKMLTLLDGVYQSKKLFIITCNDKWRVNQHMKNRPGRIFYRLEYTGLAKEFIEEYCKDTLKNKEHIDAVCRVAFMFSQFNFDILKALVEEMNRYDETPQEALQMLNAKPDQDGKADYKMELHSGGKLVPAENMNTTAWRGNPLTHRIEVMYTNQDRNGSHSRNEDFDMWREATFTVADLKKVDIETGEFQYINQKGDVLGLVKAPVAVYDWSSF